MMARPRNHTPSIKLTTSIPKDLKEMLDIYLKMEGFGKIKVGAYQKFISDRIKEFFEPAIKNIPKE